MFELMTIFMRAFILVGIPTGVAGIVKEIRYFMEVYRNERV